MAKWGIKVEWNDRGLEACGWAYGGRHDIMAFDTEADAQEYIDAMPPASYDRILTPQELVG